MRNRDAPRRQASARGHEIALVLLRVREARTIRAAAATARLQRSGHESGMTHASEHLAALGLGPATRGLTSAVPAGRDGDPVLPASRAWTGDGELVEAGSPLPVSVPQTPHRGKD